ncbi:hypothetical protein ABW20_dc0104788 [Dactylellina cionopaga]|nr:hypothetical protein ABW20_dc0104788 [Dactylellina cionopaga]
MSVVIPKVVDYYRACSAVLHLFPNFSTVRLNYGSLTINPSASNVAPDFDSVLLDAIFAALAVGGADVIDTTQKSGSYFPLLEEASMDIRTLIWPQNGRQSFFSLFEPYSVTLHTLRLSGNFRKLIEGAPHQAPFPQTAVFSKAKRLCIESSSVDLQSFHELPWRFPNLEILVALGTEKEEKAFNDINAVIRRYGEISKLKKLKILVTLGPWDPQSEHLDMWIKQTEIIIQKFVEGGMHKLKEVVFVNGIKDETGRKVRSFTIIRKGEDNYEDEVGQAGNTRSMGTWAIKCSFTTEITPLDIVKEMFGFY